jgi:hypothetical protein
MILEVEFENMRIRRGDFERIRSVLSQSEAEGPHTAREILDILEDHGLDGSFDSPHRVATVLGRRAQAGEVEVIQGQPYRYRLFEVRP